MGTRRAAAVNLARRGLHHPRVQLALKGGIAATIAWLIAGQLPGHAAQYAYYAPLGAVIATYPSVRRSAVESLRGIVGIVLGAAIALLSEAVLGISVGTVAVVVALGILAGGLRWLGSQRGLVPETALFTLVIGSTNPREFVLAFAGLTLMGGLIAVGVNLLLPALPLTRASRSLDELRHTLAKELDALAEHFCLPDDPDERVGRAGRERVDQLLFDMRAAVREAGEAAAANRRARHWRETLRAQYTQAQVLEQLGFLVQDLAHLLDDHSEVGGSLGTSPEVQLPAAQAMRALAEAVRTMGERGPDLERTAVADEAVDHLASALREHPPDTRTQPALLVTNTVVTTLRRSLNILRPREDSGA